VNRRAPPRTEADRGLSIIELVLAIVVLGILVGSGTAAVISVLRSDETVTTRTTVARGTRQLVSYLPSDVRSARVADMRTTGFDVSCLDPVDAAGQIGLQVDVIATDGWAERITYLSLVDAGAASASLWRVTCTRPPGGAFTAAGRTALAEHLVPSSPVGFEVHPDGRVVATLRPLAAAPQVVQAQAVLLDAPLPPTTMPPTTIWAPPPTTTTPLNVAAATFWLNDPVDVQPGGLQPTLDLNGPMSTWIELSAVPIEMQTDPNRVRIWATPATLAGSIQIVPPAVLHVWTTSGLGVSAPGHGVTAVLLDCPAVSTFTTVDCTLLGTASATNLSAGPDVRALDFGNLTVNVASGRRLVLKIGAHIAHATEGFTVHWGPPILPMAHLTSASRLVIG
jgi:hypothetical protein